MSQYTRRAVVTGQSACGCLPTRAHARLPRQPPRTHSANQTVPLLLKRNASKTRYLARHAAFATASSVTQTASVFPAGRKQARVKLPACILKVTVQDVLEQQDFVDTLSVATAGGITGVLLTDASGSDGAALYEAACKLRAQLRGRAVLLISDRTDIVDAAEADGVMLTSRGQLALVAIHA